MRTARRKRPEPRQRLVGGVAVWRMDVMVGFLVVVLGVVVVAVRLGTYPTAAEKDFGGKSDIKSIQGIPITPRVRHMALGTDSYVQ